MPSKAPVYEPAARDARYAGNWARYLVDLHDSRATFNFCGGMLFQIVLSDSLRARLVSSAAGQVRAFNAPTKRMIQVPGYSKSAMADNSTIFHGREVRKVKGAAGGMGFVLHLSDAAPDDPEGWSAEERSDYNGWGHDRGRPWRKLVDWEREGVQGFRKRFGDAVFGLHHRFFFRIDNVGRFWLSAEDGCEGFASPG
jgi:hypothetical protein